MTRTGAPASSSAALNSAIGGSILAVRRAALVISTASPFGSIRTFQVHQTCFKHLCGDPDEPGHVLADPRDGPELAGGEVSQPRSGAARARN